MLIVASVVGYDGWTAHCFLLQRRHPMAGLAELCELAFRQVPGFSSRSGGRFPESSSGSSWPGPEMGGRPRLPPLARIAKLTTGSYVAQGPQAGPGHQPPLRILPHCGRSTWAVLHNGHSIGATDFSRLNFGNAAIPALGLEKVSDGRCSGAGRNEYSPDPPCGPPHPSSANIL